MGGESSESPVKSSPKKGRGHRPTTVEGAHLRRHNHHSEDQEHQIELESPTSISMKNSYIIKNADPSFEAYYKSMAKRSKLGQTGGMGGSMTGQFL